MNSILQKISKIGIVPVIALDDAKDAEPLAKALCDGGLPCAEVTFRTEAAEESMKTIAAEFPHMLLGAGTVLTTDQVDRAVASGAGFIVSPGLNPKVVNYCVEKGIPIIPGCTNPSDVERAITLGLDTVKFFPAEAAGGLHMIQAMAAPYTNMKFLPTGGISAKNLNTYLDFDKIIACGGSWMVSKALIAAGQFDEITALTKKAVTAMLGFEVKHVGINAGNEEEAGSIANAFEEMFGFQKKIPHLGVNGHIAIVTNYIDRAVYHLEMQGIAFDMDTAEYSDEGKLTAVYIRGEHGGFALRLMQKQKGV